MVMVGTIGVYFVFPKHRGYQTTRKPGSRFFTSNLARPIGQESIFLDFKDKYVGLYFPQAGVLCRSFTPELIKFRNQHQENFEVVLIGGDGSPKAQSKYMKKYEMPWLAMENQSDAAKTASENLKFSTFPIW